DSLDETFLDEQNLQGFQLSSASSSNPLKAYQCPYCHRSLSSTTTLIHHIRTHTGEKPFSCPHCPYSSTAKGNLVRHMRVHTGEKPFACDLCSYRSANKSDLKNHTWTHTKLANLGL
ncbi:unnamed protein product, partial [Meganyctiphanes norvegica]